jgi:hypothetical protein
MAITIQKRMLTGSTDGQSIGVSTTAGGTHNTVHTGPSGTSIIDEVFIYANNGYSQTIELVLEWGVSTTNIHRVYQIPSRDADFCIVAGQVILGSGTAPTIKAFVGGLNGSASLAASSAFVSVYGWVNRITQT